MNGMTYIMTVPSTAWLPDSTSVTATLPDVITYIVTLDQYNPPEPEPEPVARSPVPRPCRIEPAPRNATQQHRPEHRRLHRRVR